MSHRRLGWLFAVCVTALVLLPAASAFAGDANAGDVWVDNVSEPAGPGHEMDPHLACRDINLWGSGLADSSGTYTIDGWPPSGSQEQDYAPSRWSYDPSTGAPLDVISVKTLIENAMANGDAPQNGQGFHFKLQFSADPHKHKTFWVNCGVPTIATNAASATVGQAIHDVARLKGGNSPTGAITWNVYRSSDTSCSSSLGTVTDSISGSGTYTSPDFTPSVAGGFQWVATYSGDSQNLSASTACNDPSEVSTVSRADPSLSTLASSGMLGQPVHDTATLSGGYSPTGSIVWKVYEAGAGCVMPLYTTAAVPVSGDGTYSSPTYTPSTAGTYEWVASYSGDANNVALTSSCTDTGEQSVIDAPPTIPTIPTIVQVPVQSNPVVAKQAVAPVTILRCAAGKVKKNKKVHSRTVTVCVPKKHARAASHRRTPRPRFTG